MNRLHQSHYTLPYALPCLVKEGRYKNRNNRHFRFKNKHPRKYTLLVKQNLTATMKEMLLLLQFTWPHIGKHASQ